MNKIVAGALVALVLVGATITALTQARAREGGEQRLAPTLAAQQTQVSLPARTSATGASAMPGFTRDPQTVVEGRVIPQSTLTLRFSTAGTIADVMVREGDSVKKGDIIAQLDGRAQQLAVATAEAELAEARAELAQLTAGPIPEEVEQFRARLQRAQAQQATVQASVTDKDVAAARELIAALKVKIAALQAQPRATDVASARAQLESARLNLQSVRDTLSARKTELEAKMTQAANDLRDAQDAYRRVKELNQQSSKLSQADKDAEAQALRAMQNADQNYTIAQVAYDEARKVESTTIQASEAAVQVAQAALNATLGNKQPDEIAMAQAQLAQAEAQLARLDQGYRAAEVNVSQADVAIAQADLNKAQAAPRQVDIGVAQARVQRAEAQLQQVRFGAEQLVLRAPSSGTIADLQIQPGNVVASDMEAGTVADLSQWQIVTGDLSELTIGQLREGSQVMLSFYAIPELQLPGTIARIQPMGQAQAGSETTYTVLISPGRTDARLRWNMTAAIRIVSPAQP
jgi:HlyD family secretion protein